MSSQVRATRSKPSESITDREASGYMTPSSSVGGSSPAAADGRWNLDLSSNLWQMEGIRPGQGVIEGFHLRLVATGPTSITDVYPHSEIHQDGSTTVTVQVQLAADTMALEKSAKLTAVIAGANCDAGTHKAELTVSKLTADQKIELVFQIPNVKLWWPWDLGDPNLHNVEVSVTGAAQGFRVEFALLDDAGNEISANHYNVLHGDQEQAKRDCENLSAELRAHKSEFPSADYYRFFPTMSGPERDRHIGDNPDKADGFTS